MAKPFVIDVDLKRESYIEKFKVTSNDTNTFVINIFDDGVKFDMSNITMATIAHTRIDGAVVVKEGAVGTNQVTFVLGSTETAVTGRVEATVQLYVGIERVSSLLFTYDVKRDATGNGFIPSEFDKTLIQVVLGDGPVVIQDAIDAALYANTEAEATKAVTIATEQARLDLIAQLALFETTTEEERVARLAQQEAFEADVEQKRLTFELATDEEQAAFELSIEEDRAEIRSQQATFELATAQERVDLLMQQEAYEVGLSARIDGLDARVANAETVANLAKARADLIIAQAGSANTEIVDSRLGADLVARATAGTLIREIHSAQLETARQTTTIGNGMFVVTGGVDALAETEVEGRTLISLGTSNLEANKQYVVSDKKTKLVVDGIMQSGVAKFTKGTTTVSTANFVGKVEASNVANPHKFKRVASASATSLLPPSDVAYMIELSTSHYSLVDTLNGGARTSEMLGNGAIAQHLVSFDIIAEIERKLGLIPKSTLAEKVQWVKDNVESFQANWHGFGSSVGGNKATLIRWSVTNSAWSFSYTHSNATVSKLSISEGVNAFHTIDANGFVHYLAYADASDGITPSSISTDFIDLVVTLKATAQLNTRPTIIRVENFEGKVAGSAVENAHVAKRQSKLSLLPPSDPTWAEMATDTSTLSYKDLASLNGVMSTQVTSGTGLANGNIAQQLFSFNLIESVERNIGKIPRTSVADKVQWLKDNIREISVNWYGFGSSVGGNKASLSVWDAVGNAWLPSAVNGWVHFGAGVSKNTIPTSTSLNIRIDNNGFIHYLAYADASDGTTASNINTDYVALEIELKPTADFTRPKVALYEVPATDYAKILVDWSADEVVNRYPAVEGVQHLQGVGVLAEGENLLPPFTEWTLHPNAKIISPYELELNATGSFQGSSFKFRALPNQQYNVGLTLNGVTSIDSYDTNGVKTNIAPVLSISTRSFTTRSDTNQIEMTLTNNTGAGTFTFKNLMLTLGNIAKPFVPRNPSYYFADVKLGAIGTVADRLYEQDGAKFVRKVVEKDVVLGGDLAWRSSLDFVGYKLVAIDNYTSNAIKNSEKVTKYNGKLLVNLGTGFDGGDKTEINSSGHLFFSVLDTDTGFGEPYTPSSAEIKAYFYGWKMNNGVFGTNYEATGTKTWIPIGDTTNARAVTVVPTSASPTQLDGTIQPYKLSYVLATPQVINVTDKVEGILKVNGLTQVEALSGIIRREKVVPALIGATNYVINQSNVTSHLKNKTNRILHVYKNGVFEPKALVYSNYVGSTSAFGGASVIIRSVDFDPTAEYTVTYIALDKPLLTANPTNIKLLYANNMRSSLEDVTGKLQDGLTQLSVHEKAIVDLFVRVKALEVKVP